MTSIDALTSHPYIAKAQSKYLKTHKEKLDDTKIILLCDFAENFTFVIQDEIQSYHWTQNQATLHPIVMYYKADDTIMHKSFCFISNELHHDTAMVYSSVPQPFSLRGPFLNQEFFRRPPMVID